MSKYYRLQEMLFAKIHFFVISKEKNELISSHIWRWSWSSNTSTYNNCHSFSISPQEIQKILISLSKEKGCKMIGRWRKAIVRHFYWSVTSTQSLLGEVKVAKFHAVFSHVLDVHSNLPNRLFNTCPHGIITKPKVWFTKGKYTQHITVC